MAPPVPTPMQLLIDLRTTGDRCDLPGWNIELRLLTAELEQPTFSRRMKTIVCRVVQVGTPVDTRDSRKRITIHQAPPSKLCQLHYVLRTHVSPPKTR